MSDKILTKHPEGKRGVNMPKADYEQVKNAMLEVLNEKGELTFGKLVELTRQKLSGEFDGHVGGNIVTVKLDLEARGLIHRIFGPGPQKLMLKKKPGTTSRKE